MIIDAVEMFGLTIEDLEGHVLPQYDQKAMAEM
jgi:hypothetical protein